MKTVLLSAILCVAAHAEDLSVSSSVRQDYHSIRDAFLRAAEKMPEEQYNFKPSPDVRSFAQQVAHVADDQYNLCAPAKGETRKEPYTYIESTLARKAELIAALKQAFAYCDGAYETFTDAHAADVVQFGKTKTTRFRMLNWNLWHTWEHYGNVVVYLRMKGIVPPTSEPKKPR